MFNVVHADVDQTQNHRNEFNWDPYFFNISDQLKKCGSKFEDQSKAKKDSQLCSECVQVTNNKCLFSVAYVVVVVVYL